MNVDKDIGWRRKKYMYKKNTLTQITFRTSRTHRFIRQKTKERFKLNHWT